MTAHWLQSWIGEISPEKARSMAYLAQAVVGGSLVCALFWMLGREKESGFRVRESDLRKGKLKPGVSAGFTARGGRDRLAHAKVEPSAQRRSSAPLQLEGFRADGAPHEILGVAPRASEREIQVAYRELMKRYHPDRVGRPGSREWGDAQKIAEAINRAKEVMLSARKKEQV